MGKIVCQGEEFCNLKCVCVCAGVCDICKISQNVSVLPGSVRKARPWSSAQHLGQKQSTAQAHTTARWKARQPPSHHSGRETKAAALNCPTLSTQARSKIERRKLLKGQVITDNCALCGDHLNFFPHKI